MARPSLICLWIGVVLFCGLHGRGDSKNLQGCDTEELQTLLDRVNALEKNVTEKEKELDSKIKEYTSDSNTKLTKRMTDFNSDVSSRFNDWVKKENFVDKDLLEKQIEGMGKICENKLNHEVFYVNNNITQNKNEVLLKLHEMGKKWIADLNAEKERVESLLLGLADKDSLSHVSQIVDNLVIETKNHSSLLKSLGDKVSVVSGDLDDAVNTLNENMIQSHIDANANTKSLGAMKQEVDALQKTLSTVSSRLENLHDTGISKISEEIRSLSNATSRVTQAVDELQRKEATKVAFSAFIGGRVAPGVGDVIVFKDVTVNQGQGYNNASGVFKAPAAGTYVFHLVLTMRLSDEWLDADIKTNDVIMASLSARVTQHEQQTAINSLYKLRAGQEVKVVVAYTSEGNVIVSNRLSMFSGFLLEPL